MRFVYISVFLFVKTENNNFIKEIKHACFHSLVKTSAVQQYLKSQIRVFINLCQHQQLKFDDYLYIIPAK